MRVESTTWSPGALARISGSVDNFECAMTSTVDSWRAAGLKSGWLQLSIPQQASYIEVAAKHGFRFHHAEGDTCMLKLWLHPGEDKVNKPLWPPTNHQYLRTNQPSWVCGRRSRSMLRTRWDALDLYWTNRGNYWW